MNIATICASSRSCAAASERNGQLCAGVHQPWRPQHSGVTPALWLSACWLPGAEAPGTQGQSGGTLMPCTEAKFSSFSDSLARTAVFAAVYGVLVGAGGGSSVAVSVAPSDGGAAYTVQAAHVDRVNASYSRWKAVLPPTAASQPGASVKITATAGKYSATLKDVVFGDVWICSGQSK